MFDSLTLFPDSWENCWVGDGCWLAEGEPFCPSWYDWEDKEGKAG